MFRSYFKTAFRYLLKNKTFSFLNLTGLALGTLCCLYIVLYVADQYHYDRHLKDEKNIYRIISTLSSTGGGHTMSTCSPPIAPAMKNDFAEVAEYTRAIPTLGVNQHLLHYKEKSFYEPSALFVDTSFFKVFTHHFVYGKEAGVLDAPNSIVINETVSRKLFGDENPVGKVITLDNSYGKNDLLVTGVVDESLGKSHLHANLFLRMNRGGLGDDLLTNDRWIGNNFTYSYIKVKPQTNVAGLEKKFAGFLNKYGAEQLRTSGIQKTLHLQPVREIHTTAIYDAEQDKTVSSSFLNLLLLIAGLIQLIACINFMNLSTARAGKRAREVGVRKVMGAERKSLVLQFLGESFLLSLLGILIAIPLLGICLPLLNHLVDADIQFSSLNNSNIWMILAAIVVVTGLFAGSYPALYLSSFQAIRVIKGNFTSTVSVAGFRRSLVVFQFTMSIILISGIIIIHSQLNYIKNKDLGFSINQQLVFSFHTNETKNKISLFADALRQLPEVKSASITNNYPGAFGYNDWGVFLAGGDPAHSTDQQNISTDEYSMKALGIHLKSGRDFHYNDSGAALVNETLAKKLGLDPENAAGTMLFTEGDRKYKIAGVMKDFNYRTLRDDVYPFMLIYDPSRGDLNNIIVNISSNNFTALTSKMENIWKNILPSAPFEYVFLDDEMQKLYQSDITMSRIINSFTLMAILISCLGLFGLAAFSAEQRKKEIGIRKVLGAKVSGIVQLLSQDFLKLVMVAFIIAIPISWWAMSQWLKSFAYRITPTWWMFGFAGLIAVIIAFITVSFIALKSALINPVSNLRTE